MVRMTECSLVGGFIATLSLILLAVSLCPSFLWAVDGPTSLDIFRMNRDRGASWKPGQLVVMSDMDVSEERVVQIAGQNHCKVGRRFGRRTIYVLSCEDDLENTIASIQVAKGIAWVDASYHERSEEQPDDLNAEGWHHKNFGQVVDGGQGVPGADISSLEAWAIHTGTGGPVIAILDTGIREDHEDLASRIWTNTDEVCDDGVDDDQNGYVDDCWGWDVGESDAVPSPMTLSRKDPDDDDCSRWHGSFMAGVAAAAGNNGLGVVGACGNGRVMPIKRHEDICQSNSTLSAEGVAYATDNGADILVMSFSSSAYSQTFESVLQDAAARGVLTFMSAGNDALDVDTADRYPNHYDFEHKVIVANSNHHDRLRDSSNWGANTVALAAPGSKLRAPGISSTSDYDVRSGTSYSAPLVAGAAGLVWSAFPKLGAEEVREAILGGVDWLAELDCAQTERCVQTSGRLSLAGAIGKAQELAGPASLQIIEFELVPGVVTPGGTHAIDLHIHNVGGESVNDLSVSMNVVEGPLEVVTDTLYIPSLLGGEVSASAGGLEVTVPLRCAGEQWARIEWSAVTVDGGAWSFAETLYFDCGRDADADGFADSIDCRGSNATIYPGAIERCDGVDNDCDGDIDGESAVDAMRLYPDLDGDGVGDIEHEVVTCEAVDGYVETGGDCDDEDESVGPHLDEVCDGVDNDCDLLIDNGAVDGKVWFRDDDADEFGDPDNEVRACEAPVGYVDNGDDCDDTDPGVLPGSGGWSLNCEVLTPSSGGDEGCSVAHVSDVTPVWTGWWIFGAFWICRRIRRYRASQRSTERA
jgi:hypothetical protein